MADGHLPSMEGAAGNVLHLFSPLLTPSPSLALTDRSVRRRVDEDIHRHLIAGFHPTEAGRGGGGTVQTSLRKVYIMTGRHIYFPPSLSLSLSDLSLIIVPLPTQQGEVRIKFELGDEKR